jgi:hypothetical protein
MAKVVQDRQDFKTLLGLIELVDIALYGIDLEQINATYKLTYLPKHLIQSRENIIKMNVPTLPGFADIETFIKYIDRDLIDNDNDDDDDDNDNDKAI